MTHFEAAAPGEVFEERYGGQGRREMKEASNSSVPSSSKTLFFDSSSSNAFEERKKTGEEHLSQYAVDSYLADYHTVPFEEPRYSTDISQHQPSGSISSANENPASSHTLSHFNQTETVVDEEQLEKLDESLVQESSVDKEDCKLRRDRFLGRVTTAQSNDSNASSASSANKKSASYEPSVEIETTLATDSNHEPEFHNVTSQLGVEVGAHSAEQTENVKIEDELISSRKEIENALRLAIPDANFDYKRFSMELDIKDVANVLREIQQMGHAQQMMSQEAANEEQEQEEDYSTHHLLTSSMFQSPALIEESSQKYEDSYVTQRLESEESMQSEESRMSVVDIDIFRVAVNYKSTDSVASYEATIVENEFDQNTQQSIYGNGNENKDSDGSKLDLDNKAELFEYFQPEKEFDSYYSQSPTYQLGGDRDIYSSDCHNVYATNDYYSDTTEISEQNPPKDGRSSILDEDLSFPNEANSENISNDLWNSYYYDQDRGPIYENIYPSSNPLVAESFASETGEANLFSTTYEDDAIKDPALSLVETTLPTSCEELTNENLSRLQRDSMTGKETKSADTVEFFSSMRNSLLNAFQSTTDKTSDKIENISSNLSLKTKIPAKSSHSLSFESSKVYGHEIYNEALVLDSPPPETAFNAGGVSEPTEDLNASINTQRTESPSYEAEYYPNARDQFFASVNYTPKNTNESNTNENEDKQAFNSVYGKDEERCQQSYPLMNNNSASLFLTKTYQLTPNEHSKESYDSAGSGTSSASKPRSPIASACENFDTMTSWNQNDVIGSSSSGRNNMPWSFMNSSEGTANLDKVQMQQQYGKNACGKGKCQVGGTNLISDEKEAEIAEKELGNWQVGLTSTKETLQSELTPMHLRKEDGVKGMSLMDYEEVFQQQIQENNKMALERNKREFTAMAVTSEESNNLDAPPPFASATFFCGEPTGACVDSGSSIEIETFNKSSYSYSVHAATKNQHGHDNDWACNNDPNNEDAQTYYAWERHQKPGGEKHRGGQQTLCDSRSEGEKANKASEGELGITSPFSSCPYVDKENLEATVDIREGTAEGFVRGAKSVWRENSGGGGPICSAQFDSAAAAASNFCVASTVVTCSSSITPAFSLSSLSHNSKLTYQREDSKEMFHSSSSNKNNPLSDIGNNSKRPKEENDEEVWIKTASEGMLKISKEGCSGAGIITLKGEESNRCIDKFEGMEKRSDQVNKNFCCCWSAAAAAALKEKEDAKESCWFTPSSHLTGQSGATGTDNYVITDKSSCSLAGASSQVPLDVSSHKLRNLDAQNASSGMAQQQQTCCDTRRSDCDKVIQGESPRYGAAEKDVQLGIGDSAISGPLQSLMINKQNFHNQKLPVSSSPVKNTYCDINLTSNTSAHTSCNSHAINSSEYVNESPSNGLKTTTMTSSSDQISHNLPSTNNHDVFEKELKLNENRMTRSQKEQVNIAANNFSCPRCTGEKHGAIAKETDSSINQSSQKSNPVAVSFFEIHGKKEAPIGHDCRSQKSGSSGSEIDSTQVPPLFHASHSFSDIPSSCSQLQPTTNPLSSFIFKYSSRENSAITSCPNTSFVIGHTTTTPITSPSEHDSSLSENLLNMEVRSFTLDYVTSSSSMTSSERAITSSTSCKPSSIPSYLTCSSLMAGSPTGLLQGRVTPITVEVPETPLLATLAKSALLSGMLKSI